MGEKVLVEAWGVSGDWEEPGGVLEESWGGVLGASLGVLASFGRSRWGSWREDLGGWGHVGSRGLSCGFPGGSSGSWGKALGRS